MAETTLTVSKRNDKIDIQLGKGDTYIIPPSKGNDSLNFSFAENMNGGEFEYTQAENSKDLHITYTKGDVTDTIIINNYFKKNDGKATSSSVKTVVIDGENYDLTDLYKYVGPFTPSKKGSVTGTVFSDIIDESGYTNDKKKGLTIKSGNGDDVIIGSRYNDTITGGKGNNTVVLQGKFGDDKIVTTKNETVNISLDRDMNQLEYVLDGKNVKAVAPFPETSYYLKGLLSVSEPMELSNGCYYTINSDVGNSEEGRSPSITITLYTPEYKDNGDLEYALYDTYTLQRAYTYFYVVEDGEGGYKWQSEDLLASYHKPALAQDNLQKAELRLDTEPRLSLLDSSSLDSVWTDTGIHSASFNYMIMDSQVYRVEYYTNENDEIERRDINVSKEVAKLLKDEKYDPSSFFGTKGEVDGSVSIIGMASKKLTADVLVNGTNLEEYLSTEGNYLNVNGQKKLTGTRFNDRFVGSEYNDTITGKGGHNLYEIDTTKYFGEDTVVLTKDETMTLEFNHNDYDINDLKFELVNGGKDIKISSDVDQTVSDISYEITGLLTPLQINLGQDEDGEDIIITDDVQEPYEVTFKVVRQNGEYKWVCDNILADIAPTANPIPLELPLDSLGIGENDYEDGIFDEGAPGYMYPAIEDLTWDEDLIITVTEMRAHCYIDGNDSDISNALNQAIVDGTYNIESYFNKSTQPLDNFEGSVTLKNFGQKDLGAIVNIGESDLAEYLKNEGVVQVSGKGKITATRFNDDITGSSSADKIYTYAGTDSVNAGKGNDKIYLAEGNKTLSFKSGDGNDIIYSAKLADSIDLQIAETEFDNMEYTRKGNNLVITRIDNDGKTVNNKKIALSKLYVTKDGELTNVKTADATKVTKTLYSYEVDGENGAKITKYSAIEVENGTNVSNNQFFLENGKVVTNNTHQEALSETITIDGYFKDATNITLNGDDLITSNDKVKYSGSGRVTFGDDGYNYDITTGKKNDTITLDGGDNIVSSGAGNDKVTITGNGDNILNYTAGNDKYTVGEGDDTYNVLFNKNTNLKISDNGGTDVLNITTTGNITCLFDVDKNGNIVADSSLLICDSGSVKRSKSWISGGMVELVDYFNGNDAGKGRIEEININDASFNINAGEIATNVAAWLNDSSKHTGNYETARDVMEHGTSADFQSLLAVYQGNAQ